MGATQMLEEEQVLDLAVTPQEVETKTNTVTDAVEDQASEEVNDHTANDPNEEAQKGNELPKGIRRRLAKMTKEKSNLRRELDELRNQVSAFTKVKEPEYTKADFGDDSEAYLDYKVDQKLRSQHESQVKHVNEQRELQAKQNDINTTWQSKIDSVKSEMPDYAEAVNNSTVDFTQDEVEIIMESEFGPQLAYELATNDDLATKFSNLPSPKARDRFLTRLEYKFENAPVKAPNKAVSNAPKPTPKISNNASGGGSNIDSSKLSMDEWVKMRNAQLK